MRASDHYPDGWGNLPSVTQVLGVIASPALMAWLRRTSSQQIQQVSDKALDIGSTVHQACQDILLGKSPAVETSYPEEIQSCISAFLKFIKDKKIVPLHTELKMMSRELGYKGTADNIVMIDDCLAQFEWKTSKAIYESYPLQAIAYARLFEFEHKRHIKENWIIRLGKEKAELETYLIPKEKEAYLFETFNHALAIYNWQQKEKTK